VQFDDTMVHWVAEDFLRAMTLTLPDWAWTYLETMITIASLRWTAPARALERWIMPELSMRLGIISGATACLPAAEIHP